MTVKQYLDCFLLKLPGECATLSILRFRLTLGLAIEASAKSASNTPIQGVGAHEVWSTQKHNLYVLWCFGFRDEFLGLLLMLRSRNCQFSCRIQETNVFQSGFTTLCKFAETLDIRFHSP